MKAMRVTNKSAFANDKKVNRKIFANLVGKKIFLLRAAWRNLSQMYVVRREAMAKAVYTVLGNVVL